MTDILKRSWAEIRLDAVEHNYRAVRDLLADDCRVMAVVKADAYGHGDVAVSTALQTLGADWFGVATLDEAVHLREHGIDKPILILSYTPPECAAQLAHYGITQTILDRDYAVRLNNCATADGVTVDCHVKLDTGMSRVGFFYHDETADRTAIDDIASCCALPSLSVDGIFTHFSVADEADGETYTRRQFARFQHAIAALETRGISFALKHCCNSAATLRFPDMHLDLVRPGIVLYGLPPSAFLDGAVPLVPVMTLKTVVAQVKTVPCDTAVSYGCTHTTTDTATLATIPLGYADGYPRVLSDTACMLINGHRVPLVGRVCMDQCVLDVTDVGDVSPETPVTVFGEDAVTAAELATLSGTIPYELVCGIGKRIPRIVCERT